MWGRLCLLWMLVWTTASGAPSISTVCPENCECSPLKEGLKAHCSSMDFLGKLRPKQIQQITELDLSGCLLKKIDNKLTKLRNLKKLYLSKNDIEDLQNFPNIPHLTHLHLSHNNIKRVTASDLPKSLKHLDLSSNYIVNVTDLSHMSNLKEINLNDNPLLCECDFLKERDLLLRNDVHINRPGNCYSPKNVRDISMFSVYCASGSVIYDDFEHMLRDEAGSGEDSAIVPASSSLDVFHFDNTEEDAITNDDEVETDYFKTSVDSNSSLSESDEDSIEGSGSAYLNVRGGSGDGEYAPIPPDPAVPHCYYNCSTPAPERDTNASAPPVDLKQEISRIFNTITGKDTETTTSTISTTTTTVLPIVVQEEVQKQSAATLSKTAVKETQQGEDKNREAPKESETTANVEKNNTATYVIVGVLFLAMVALVAYVVVKKQSKRNNNNRRSPSNNDIKELPAVEMKPLMSEAIPMKPNPVPEITPLMNGQNGTGKKSEVEEPVTTDTVDGKSPTENGIDLPQEEEELQIRPKNDEDVLLTPSTKRVTIQAMELSSPKSPVLVHRHLGDDGNIVSSPVSNNEFKYT